MLTECDGVPLPPCSYAFLGVYRNGPGIRFSNLGDEK